MQFKSYVDAAAGVVENLAFVLDTLGARIALDGSGESLKRLERLYWEVQGGSAALESIGGIAMLQLLLGQYLGESIIKSAGGRWVQSQEKNHRYAQPCIDGFGNEPWGRVFPVPIAEGLADIVREQPHFVGARTRTMLFEQFRMACKIAEKRRGVVSSLAGH